MQVPVIKAAERDKLGTRPARRERGAGRLPVVLYGHGEEVRHLVISATDFEAALRRNERVFEIDQGGKKERALLKDLQYDAFGEHPVHADFTRVSANEEVQIRVEIEFVGHPQGVSKGGRFVHPISELMIECKPADIPEKIEVIVNDLDIGDGFYIRDLTFSSGTRCVQDPDTLICSIHAPGGPESGEEEEAPVEQGGEPKVIGEAEGGEGESEG